MREQVHTGLYGTTLRVYPFLEDDAADEDLEHALYVEAYYAVVDYTVKGRERREWRVGGKLAAASFDWNRERWERFKRAVERCWEWAGEQERR